TPAGAERTVVPGDPRGRPGVNRRCETPGQDAWPGRSGPAVGTVLLLDSCVTCGRPSCPRRSRPRSECELNHIPGRAGRDDDGGAWPSAFSTVAAGHTCALRYPPMCTTLWKQHTGPAMRWPHLSGRTPWVG